ncbi:hypothetical protein TNCV_114431 [Trichonephila clavipes]|nr:hypothetical protein TNCV_114431 [Trichonephila clavipes]
MDFVTDVASEGTPMCQPNGSVRNAGATCDCTGADFPRAWANPRLHFILNRLSGIPPCAPVGHYRGLSSKQPTRRFELPKSFSPQLHLSTDLYPFVWR